MRRVNPWAYALLIKHLEPGELSCQELADATGLGRLTVYYYTKALHKVGMVHITELRRDVNGRRNTRIYKLGRGKDEKAHTNTSQINKDYRARRRQIRLQNALAGTRSCA